MAFCGPETDRAKTTKDGDQVVLIGVRAAGPNVVRLKRLYVEAADGMGLSFVAASSLDRSSRRRLGGPSSAIST